MTEERYGVRDDESDEEFVVIRTKLPSRAISSTKPSYMYVVEGEGWVVVEEAVNRFVCHANGRRFTRIAG